MMGWKERLLAYFVSSGTLTPQRSRELTAVSFYCSKRF